MSTDTTSPLREIESRTSDGLHVRLLWSQDDGRLAVSVHDSRTNEEFCLVVRDGESPLDVFYHPFAYAV